MKPSTKLKNYWVRGRLIPTNEPRGQGLINISSGVLFAKRISYC